MHMIQKHNIEEGRLLRGVGQVDVYPVDEYNHDLPRHCYLTVTENGKHYVRTKPNPTCDCRDFIMKGVEDEGYDEGIICKHLIAALFYFEEHPVVTEELDRLKRESANGQEGES